MYAQLRSLGLITVIILGVSLAGCKTKTASRSSGATKSGSREVKFSVDDNGGVSTHSDTSGGYLSTVTFSHGKVIVEKSRVLFTDKELAQLPEDTKVVEVDYTAGTLTITADGTKIYNARLRD